MNTSPNGQEGFEEFVAATQYRLFRTAYMLCGDREHARDLTQEALIRLYRFWPRVVRADNQEAYAKKALLNAFLDEQRRFRLRRRDGHLLDSSHDHDQQPSPDLRIVLMTALAGLPAKRRAALVLRFFEDLSIEATAEILGCSTGTVKSQTSRGLATLRTVLADTHVELSEL